jgi:hypothetical protein
MRGNPMARDLEPALNLGHVDAGGVILPVVQVDLLGGSFIVRIRRRGPLNAYSGPVSLYGSDGVLITRGGNLSWPVVARREELAAHLTCTPGSTEADDAHPVVIPGQIEHATPRALPAPSITVIDDIK